MPIRDVLRKARREAATAAPTLPTLRLPPPALSKDAPNVMGHMLERRAHPTSESSLVTTNWPLLATAGAAITLHAPRIAKQGGRCASGCNRGTGTAALHLAKMSALHAWRTRQQHPRHLCLQCRQPLTQADSCGQLQKHGVRVTLQQPSVSVTMSASSQHDSDGDQPLVADSSRQLNGRVSTELNPLYVDALLGLRHSHTYHCVSASCDSAPQHSPAVLAGA